MYKVLIVEDNRAIQRNLKMLVEKAGEMFRIEGVCQNGKRALEFLSEKETDIIITDIRMPVLDGLELIQEWTAQNKKTKYIIVSGYDEFEYARRGLSLGVSEYLLKPVTFQDMQKALNKVVLQIREEKEKEKQILSYEMKEDMLQPPKLSISKERIDQETIYITTILTPTLISWDEQEYLQAIDTIIDHWYEQDYLKEDLRLLLLSMTELVLRSKGCLNDINMIQPIENILTFSGNYHELKKVSLEYYQALYMRINGILVENIYTPKQFFETIRNFLDTHIYHNISMTDLSENFHVSASYISRIFKKYADVSPMTYYNRQKIKEACHLLGTEKNCKVKDVAEMLGYQNQNYFSKAFKSATGYTPVEYKEKSEKE